ncbi:Ribonucleases P/MRP protein subunit pop1 [Conglomerata obtusa]
MNIDEIDANNFVDARSAEIQILEKKINQTTKKTQLFQRLPFHKRRRTKSRDTRRTPNKHARRKKRKGKKHLHPMLVTHVWFAKRFEMIELFNTKLPLQRRIKSDKFIYKSYDRGFIFDDSYKDIRIYNIKDINNSALVQNSLNVKIICNNETIEYKNVKEFLDVIDENIVIETFLKIENNFVKCDFIKISNFLISVCMFNDILDTLMRCLEYTKFDICFSVFKGTRYFSETGIYKLTEKIDTPFENYMNDMMQLCIEDSAFSTEFLFVQNKINFETGKIFVKRENAMKVWQMLNNVGFIPISINEMLRLGLEEKKLIFPFDYPNSIFYEEFEEKLVKPIKEKYDRTPPAKRINYEKNGIYQPFIIPKNISSFYICYFTVKKGVANRLAIIYDNDDIVGYVLRGAYCFSLGKCRGVCIIKNIAKNAYKAKNISNTNYIEIDLDLSQAIFQ